MCLCMQDDNSLLQSYYSWILFEFISLNRSWNYVSAPPANWIINFILCNVKWNTVSWRRWLERLASLNEQKQKQNNRGCWQRRWNNTDHFKSNEYFEFLLLYSNFFSVRILSPIKFFLSSIFSLFVSTEAKKKHTKSQRYYGDTLNIYRWLANVDLTNVDSIFCCKFLPTKMP